MKETEKQRRGVRKAISGVNARAREEGRRTRQAEEEEGRRGSVLRELRGGREAEGGAAAGLSVALVLRGEAGSGAVGGMREDR